ncbi:pyridoxamine 5'-phosphate oxidase family protein [Pseudomonas sp. NyZ704]|nr:pyridoxamine 5'-phosphate oxidase family protein [Pseudomonas sp. NyZ704]
MLDPKHVINNADQLAALYGDVAEVSQKKEIDFIHPLYQALIQASPFAVLATSGDGGLDASPRGDAPGFVQVQDEKTLLLPERRGNNRVDSLRNLLTDPRVALFFMIPGVGETLRVSGRATITVEPELMERFAVKGKPPKCVLVIEVENVFFQCARAIKRSRLWDEQANQPAATLPSAGTILAALSNGSVDAKRYDDELPGRQQDTLY